MRTRSTIVWIGLAPSLIFLPCARLHASDPLAHVRRFVSVKGGYTVDYPDTWHVMDRSMPTLYIVNFPPPKRVRAVVLPEEGASIAIVPPPDGVSDAGRWLSRDLKPLTEEVSKTRLDLRTADTREPLDTTEVVLRWGSPGPQFEGVNSYFLASGHLLSARLTYWKGDTRAPEYRETLHRIIESLRPINGR